MPEMLTDSDGVDRRWDFVARHQRISRNEGDNDFEFECEARDVMNRQRKERELHQSEQLLRRTFLSIRDALLVVDAATSKISDCNAGACSTFGYSREEMLQLRTINLHVDEAALERFRKHAYSALDAQGFFFLPEFQMRRRDGTVFPTEHSVAPIEDPHGRTQGWVSLVRDLTESKRTLHALRESEERFRAIYQDATVGLYRTAPDGQILMANPTLVRMLGFSSFEELVERDLGPEGFPPEHPRSEFLHRVETDGRVSGFETAWTNRAGTTVFVRESARAVRDDTGKTRYYEGSVEDITDRKQAETALQASEQRYRELADNIQEAFFALDIDLKYTYWNAACETLTGITEADAIGKSLYELFPRVAGTAADSLYKRVLKTRQPGRAESRYHLDGEEMVFELSAFPTHTGAAVLARDITADKRYEREIRELNATLERRIARRTAELEEAKDDVERIFATSVDMICIADINGRFLKVNPAFHRVLGHAEEDLLSKPFLDFVHPDDRKATADVMHNVLARGIPVADFENRYRCANGSYRWLRWCSRPVPEEGIQYAVAHDATSQKKVAEELHVYRDKLEHLVAERTGELQAANERLQTEIRERMQAEKLLEESRAQLRNLAASLQDVREEERAELARELHDELGQKLSGMKMDLAAIAHGLPKRMETVRARIAELAELADQLSRGHKTSRRGCARRC